MTDDDQSRHGIPARIDIERCHLNGNCTQRWETLELVRDEPRVRYCSQCQAAVHLAQGEDELAELARMGKNVAVSRDGAAVAGAARAEGLQNT